MTDGVPTQLGHIALRVRDLERSVQFYSDVMGLKLRARHETVAFLGIREDASPITRNTSHFVPHYFD